MRIRLFLYACAVLTCTLFSTCKKEDDETVLLPEACFSYTIQEDGKGDKYVAYTNCSQNAFSYSWDFGDYSFSSEESPKHYYEKNGTYIVYLSAYNELRDILPTNISDTIVVDWFPETEACFSYNLKKDNNQKTYVEFINCSQDAALYLWDFGDGSSSREENPIHHYYENGKYTITLFAFEYYQSESVQISSTVSVDWIDTTAIKACFNYSIEENEKGEVFVEFTNCSKNATSYNWDFGDDSFSTEENPVHTYSTIDEYLVKLTAYNETDSITISKWISLEPLVSEKPNIYLYPENNMDICVRLDFPKGGEVVKSEPTYNDGWCVNGDPSGIIENQYGYLFYESIQPSLWQYKEGWCIRKESLKSFFETNMKAYNFSEKEIKDFTDYWIPLLVDSEYYNIYPQCNEQINKLVQLNFSIEPDNIFRLFYGVVGVSAYQEFPEPKIKKMKRNGFYVVEWGVFRK